MPSQGESSVGDCQPGIATWHNRIATHSQDIWTIGVVGQHARFSIWRSPVQIRHGSPSPHPEAFLLVLHQEEKSLALATWMLCPTGGTAAWIASKTSPSA